MDILKWKKIRKIIKNLIKIKYRKRKNRKFKVKIKIGEKKYEIIIKKFRKIKIMILLKFSLWR